MGIKTDASKKAWGAANKGISNGGACTVEESGLHINIQELKARRLGLRFTLKVKSIHVKTNNMTALSYLVKKGNEVLDLERNNKGNFGVSHKA